MQRIFQWLLAGAVCVFSLELSAADTITISGNPAAMNITTAVAGQNPTTVTDTSRTYTITHTTATTLSITGKISAAMPTNVILKLSLAKPGTATSQGLVTMTTTARNLVTNITSGVSGSGLTMTYQLSATAKAAPVTTTTRTLTLTYL